MATNIKSYPNLIDGTWKTSSVNPLEDRNPADYKETIGRFPMAAFKGSSANTFKEQGQSAVDFYTRTKTIYINHG